MTAWVLVAALSIILAVLAIRAWRRAGRTVDMLAGLEPPDAEVAEVAELVSVLVSASRGLGREPVMRDFALAVFAHYRLEKRQVTR